jgi:hypothetical protein
MMTPLEEMLNELGLRIALDLDAEMSRADYLKAVWQNAIVTAPADIFDGGTIFHTHDPLTGECLEFHKITYGSDTVAEIEGVVVCRL